MICDQCEKPIVIKVGVPYYRCIDNTGAELFYCQPCGELLFAAVFECTVKACTWSGSIMDLPAHAQTHKHNQYPDREAGKGRHDGH